MWHGADSCTGGFAVLPAQTAPVAHCGITILTTDRSWGSRECRFPKSSARNVQSCGPLHVRLRNPDRSFRRIRAVGFSESSAFHCCGIMLRQWDTIAIGRCQTGRFGCGWLLQPSHLVWASHGIVRNFNPIAPDALAIPAACVVVLVTAVAVSSRRSERRLSDSARSTPVESGHE